ncbi:hypothetical protein TruAng_011984 [Truncatella angustata]|nr:hypothetical protein TruAng_011984 [Truncatella angustata]
MATTSHATAQLISETTIAASIATPASTGGLASKTPPPTPSVQIQMAPAAAAEDEALIMQLCDIVNLVYGETEGDIFVEGYQRVRTDEMRQIVRAGELAVAYLPLGESSSTSQRWSVIGCMRLQTLAGSQTGEMGMFAIDPVHRGGGTGREMAAFAEGHCRSVLGLTRMRLELLVPLGFEHAFKKRLQAWYERMGYVLVKLGVFQDDYPQLAPLLKGPCEYRVFEKDLA